MKIAIAQITTDPGRLAANTAKIITHIDRARRAGAALVVFPELTIPGYGHMDLVLDKEFVAENLRCLEQIIQASTDIAVIVGFVDRERGTRTSSARRVLFNAAAVIENRQLLAVRDKTLLPHYDIFFERRYFQTARTQGIVKAAGKRLGVGICEDLWDEAYEQKVYPHLVAQGAELLVNISASPFHLNRFPERHRVVLNARGGARLPVVYANLVGAFDGYEGEIVFDGRSLVVAANGALIALGRGFEEELLLADLDSPETVAAEVEVETEELYRALVFGIREYFRRNGKHNAYIGLSGGIDSSVVAALAVAALGKAHVIGVTMPSHITSAETRTDAFRVANNLEIRCELRDISGEFKAWRREFEQRMGHLPQGLTEENKQARIRGSILMDFANEDRDSLLISTGNKTELALGYCTLYGDMCGGFAAISDVSKARVYALAALINQRAGRELIPRSVLLRPPTAELAEGQSDAASLPADYPILSPLVQEIVDEETPPQRLYKRYDRAVVDDAYALVYRNEFKRRQAAPGIRVTRKAFGIGRRIPMDFRRDSGGSP